MPVLKTRMYEFRKALNLQQAELAERLELEKTWEGLI